MGRQRRVVFLAAMVSVAVGATAAVAAAESATTPDGGVVGRVVDGDTIALRDGRRVRLVQIDAPEVGSGECFSRASARALRALLPAGASVRLESDGRLDEVDRYGRLLRYVWRGAINANLELVRRGAAAPWFYGGVRGKYADALMASASAARRARSGFWGSCRGTILDPGKAVATRQGGAPSPVVPLTPANPAPGRSCQPGYSPCLPITGDLDCGEIPAASKPVRVTGGDPYRLDRDGDGIGCEDG